VCTPTQGIQLVCFPPPPFSILTDTKAVRPAFLLSSPPTAYNFINVLGSLFSNLMCYIVVIWELISDKFPFSSRKKLLLGVELNFDDSLVNVHVKIVGTDFNRPSSEFFHLFLRPSCMFNFSV
jgi:hypothetical protein